MKVKEIQWIQGEPGFKEKGQEAEWIDIFP
jgi:hypothetical protein